MRIEITEKDFEDALGSVEVATKIRKDTAVLGASDLETLTDFLPRVIASKINSILPKDGFVLHEIEMVLSIKGAPFGLGVTGDVKVRFGPKDC